MAQCLDYLENPGIRQGYFAPTYPQIRDIFYSTMDEVAHWFGLRTAIRTGDKEVHVYSGRQYRGTTICRSMQDPGSIIGFKIGHAMVDELDTMPTAKARLAWNKILGRMRWEGVPNRVDVTTTPEGFKFTYETFAKDPEASYGMVQASTYDNEANLPDGYIDAMMEAYPAELRAAYLDGQFVNLTSGTVFYGFNRATCGTDVVEQQNEPLRIGMDFNIGTMAAAVYVVRDGAWHQVGELTGIFDTPAMIRTIQTRYEGHSIRVYPDATGKNRRSTNDGSKTEHSLLRDAGFSVYSHKGNPAVQGRILAANKAYQSGAVRVNIARCPETARCLEQLAYGKNSEPDKGSGFDHLTDAATYPIEFEMPIVRPAAQLNVRFAR